MSSEDNEILSPSGLYLTDTVIAGQRKAINAQGDHFYFTECSGTVEISTDMTAAAPFSVGEGERLPRGFEFKRMTLKNTSAEDISYELFVGRNRRIDNRLNVVDGRIASTARFQQDATKLYYPQASDTIAATTTVSFGSVASGTQLRRKSIIVSNNDTTNNLTIRDIANSRDVAYIFPKTAFQLDTSDSVAVRNDSGSPISYGVTEIWYEQV